MNGIPDKVGSPVKYQLLGALLVEKCVSQQLGNAVQTKALEGIRITILISAESIPDLIWDRVYRDVFADGYSDEFIS